MSADRKTGNKWAGVNAMIIVFDRFFEKINGVINIWHNMA
jgi:hypothetical protein